MLISVSLYTNPHKSILGAKNFIPNLLAANRHKLFVFINQYWKIIKPVLVVFHDHDEKEASILASLIKVFN
jgi:hypothetical protein